MRSMMNMILLTFILTYIVVNWVHLVRRWIPKLSPGIIVIITYALLLWLLYLGITQYLPVLVRQIIRMVNSVLKFYSSNDATAFFHYINRYISMATIMGQVKHGLTLAVSTITSVGALAVTFVMSLILSFFYTLELNQTESFSACFWTANLAGSFRILLTLAKNLLTLSGWFWKRNFSLPFAILSLPLSAWRSWRCPRFLHCHWLFLSLA